MYSDYKLPPEFLKEEVRCEFKVSVDKKKIWAVELELLHELLRVCAKHDIKVFAFAGTLLGCIRHQGFIPWDDDIDVCLLPEDYQKLISVAPLEFKEPFFFQNAYTDKKYHIGYSRLRNSNTTGLITYNYSEEYNNGIFVDVFVMNGLVDNKTKLKVQLCELNLVERLIHAYFSETRKQRNIKHWCMSILSSIMKKTISYDYLLKIYDKIISRYDNQADKVSILTHNRTKGFIDRYWCQKDELKECRMMSFENILIPVPMDYDKILCHLYGDYKKFPPVEERGKWHDNVIIFNPDISYKDYILQEKEGRSNK